LMKELHANGHFFDAVGANVSSNLDLEGVRFHNIRVPKDDLRLKSMMVMNAGGLYYSIMGLVASKKILMANDIEIIHHMFPSSAGISYSLIPIFSISGPKLPFIFGPVCERVHGSRITAMGRMHDLTCHRANVIIVQTRRLLKEYSFKFGDRVKRIPLGVDTVSFRPGKGGDGRTILTVANLHHMKGVDVLLRSMRKVVDVHKDANLIIAGDGPERNALQSLCKKLGLEENVEMLGRVSYDKIAELYRKSDIFCSPSREEAFGRAMLEAMASGIPVVATSTLGASEIIDHGSDGTLVPLENHDALASELLNLLEERSMARRYGQRGRNKIEAEYSWHSIAELYNRTYSEVCGR